MHFIKSLGQFDQGKKKIIWNLSERKVKKKLLSIEKCQILNWNSHFYPQTFSSDDKRCKQYSLSTLRNVCFFTTVTCILESERNVSIFIVGIFFSIWFNLKKKNCLRSSVYHFKKDQSNSRKIYRLAPCCYGSKKYRKWVINYFSAVLRVGKT